MGRAARRKHARSDRKSQPPKPDSAVVDKTSGADSTSCLNPMGFQRGSNKSVQNFQNPSFDNLVSDYTTDEQLRELLVSKLKLLYMEAIAKLVKLGYNEIDVLDAVLMNGHCHGDMDPFTNIMNNTQLCLSNRAGFGTNDTVAIADAREAFSDHQQLFEESSVTLVCMLRINNPCSNITDAMRCLLLSDLHVIRPNSMKISDAPSFNDDGDGATIETDEDVHPIWSDPTPSMLVLLKDNAAFLAEEYARMECEGETDQSDGDSSSSVEKDSNVNLEVLRVTNQECTKSVLERFEKLNLEKDSESLPEDHEDVMLVSLVKEVKDLEIQVKERKKWADERAVQAARRLCEGRNELKKLRMEKKDVERIEEKSTLDIDDPTMKKLKDVEMKLEEISATLDSALMYVRQLEEENMEIRAEIEASKLSTSESVTARLEVAKREKKHNKKIASEEKQKGKLHDDITSEKQKLMHLNEEMLQVEAARKIAEAKWREEQEFKKHAIARVKQERRLKEESELINIRRHEFLREKMDLDFKRHKDDIQRLEKELSRVKSYTDQDHDMGSLFGTQFDDETIGKLLHGSGVEPGNEDDVVGHECVICEENETSVVFLPCAHEVVCVDCNEELKKAECPTCRVGIEQRIRAFGGSS